MFIGIFKPAAVNICKRIVEFIGTQRYVDYARRPSSPRQKVSRHSGEHHRRRHRNLGRSAGRNLRVHSRYCFFIHVTLQQLIQRHFLLRYCCLQGRTNVRVNYVITFSCSLCKKIAICFYCYF